MDTFETSLMQDMVKDGVGIILATESTAISLEDDDIAALPIEPDQDLVTLIIYNDKRKLRGAYLAFRNYVVTQLMYQNTLKCNGNGLDSYELFSL